MHAIVSKASGSGCRAETIRETISTMGEGLDGWIGESMMDGCMMHKWTDRWMDGWG